MKFKNLEKKGIKLLPVITIFFILIVAKILYTNIAHVDWNEVGIALNSIPLKHILLSLIFSTVSYSILVNYDYLAFCYLKIRSIKKIKIYPSAFISYAFNFNFGALIGGLAFRYRIYTGWKISKTKISKLIFFSIMTTWLGYAFLLAIILLFNTQWTLIWPSIHSEVAFIIGIIILSLLIFYIFLCSRQKTIKFNTYKISLPSLKFTILQIILSVVQWCLPCGIIFLFLKSLGSDVTFTTVLLTYLMASIAGVLARIPAGLGTIEAVFFKFDVASQSDTLAALLCFRLVYYLIPLLIATVFYFYIEYYQKSKKLRIRV